MVTVAIISEYNPFHLGHEYQIKEIRRNFGEDTAIIAVMSGNYTQRGDIAIADKYMRAKLATLAGINLVLELPFPYSSSSAEFFARAAVHIVNSLGAVDYLSFGSELGNIDTLEKIALNLLSEKYTRTLTAMSFEDENRELGHAALCELAYKAAFGEDIGKTLAPNNILALEYIKALILTKSSVKPHTVKRVGGAYDDAKVGKSAMPSAMAIRELIQKNDVSAFDYLPKSAKSDILSAYGKDFPTDAEKLSAAVLSTLRLNPPGRSATFHDTEGGLYNRLHAMSFEADSIQSLVALTSTKKYTTARIKRAVLYTLLGVTSSDVRELPRYTQLLAFDAKGQEVLKKLKASSQIPIITKPSRIDSLDAIGKRQKELSDKSDSLFQLTKPMHVSGKYSLLCSPFVKNSD